MYQPGDGPRFWDRRPAVPRLTRTGILVASVPTRALRHSLTETPVVRRVREFLTRDAPAAMRLPPASGARSVS